MSSETPPSSTSAPRREQLAEVELLDPAATDAVGAWLGAHLRSGQGLALVGELGAGKTCLARGVARGLGVTDHDAVASPTYLVVVEHPGDPPMVHVDAYLPGKARAFLLDGGVDYLAELDGVVVVEWADRIADLLPEQTLWAELVPRRGGGRRARLSGDARAFAWVRGLDAAFPGRSGDDLA